MSIYEVILERLDKGRSGVLATVIRRAGSAPRDVGAKMFVCQDGKIKGTVGGGRLELDAFKKAKDVIGTGRPSILSVRMDAKEISGEEMLCGGNVEILLEPVLPEHLPLYRHIVQREKERKRGVVVTGFTGEAISKSVLGEDLQIVGDPVDSQVLSRCRDCLRDQKMVYEDGLMIEPILISFPLYIFGAGHVSQHLSVIATAAGFHVTVIDDRNEFANKERFPDADIITTHHLDAFKCLEFTGNEYVVILTRSHEHDAQALERAMGAPLKYVGMIGSSRKVRIILDHLRQKGFHEKAIQKIHSPIGVSINAETPVEIAISIVAQLISVKNEGQKKKKRQG